MRRKLLICFLLVAATLAVFWQVRNHDFINLDDSAYVTENPYVQAGLNSNSVVWAFTSTHAGFWIPLTWLSLMLDFELYGLNPGGYHVTNLFFHLANSLLLFLLLRKMTRQTWQSAFVAALFALHPLRVESVAWVTERKDVLSTFFWMLTILAYIRYTESPDVFKYILALVAFTFGLMAKPIVVTLPFVLLLIDYWPLGRFSFTEMGGGIESDLSNFATSKQKSSSFFSLFWEKFPFFALAAISSAVTFYAQQNAGAVVSLDSLPIKARIANALLSYAGYIWKMIWPSNLAVFYPHPGEALPMWQTAGAGLLLATISLLVLRLAPRYRYLAVGWLWYLGTLVPVIGLVQSGVQSMADRFTYVPLIGLFIIIAWGFPDLLGKWHHRKIIITTAAGLLLPVLMTSTWLQVRLWRNDLTLFEHALAVTTNNYVAHNQMGSALLAEGRIQRAISHYTKAVQINHRYADAHFNLALAFTRQNNIDEAISHFTNAVKFKPNFAEAHINLGEALARQDKLDEAISHFSWALRIKPDWAEAHNNLGNVLAKQGKLDEAMTQYSEALRLRPDYADAHTNLAVALAHQGRFEEAISHYREALQGKPDSAETHNNLGVALVNLGKLESAAQHYLRALQLRPDYAEAYNNLGNMLAMQGKLDEAVARFSQALQLKPDYAEAHNNLGVALARQGRPDEAIAHFKQALQLRPTYLEARANLGIALEEAGKSSTEVDRSP